MEPITLEFNYHKLPPQTQDKLIRTQLPLVVAVNCQRHRKPMLEKTYTALSKGMYRINGASFPKLVPAFRSVTSTPADTDYDKSSQEPATATYLMHSYSSR